MTDLERALLIACGAYYALVATQLLISQDTDILDETVRDLEIDVVRAAQALLDRVGIVSGVALVKAANDEARRRFTP